MLLLNNIFTDFENFYNLRVLLNFVFFGQTLDIYENKVAGRMVIIFFGSFGQNVGWLREVMVLILVRTEQCGT